MAEYSTYQEQWDHGMRTQADLWMPFDRPLPTMRALTSKLSSKALSGSGSSKKGNSVRQLEELPLLAAKHVGELAYNESGRLPKSVRVSVAGLFTSHSKRRMLKMKFVRRMVAGYVVKRLEGVLLVTAGVLAFSGLLDLAKAEDTSTKVSTIETVFWRSLLAFVINFVAVIASGDSLQVKKKFRTALAARCIAACCATFITIYVVDMLTPDASQARGLLLSSPILTFFMGAWMMKEKIDIFNLFFGIVAFAGAIIVVQSTVSSTTNAKTNPPALLSLWASVAAVAQSIEFISVRHLKRLDRLIVLHYGLLTVSLVSGALVYVIQQDFTVLHSMQSWPMLLETGSLWFVTQLFFTRGFQLEKAGPAAVTCYLMAVFPLLFDGKLLEADVTTGTAAGAITIVACVVIIAYRKVRHRR